MTPTPTTSTAALPLAGLRIIDLTTVLMGPYATQQLGDMGADVIKVESPEGDILRQIGPERNAGMGPVYLNANRSKRAIVLDLKKAEGKEVLFRLIKDADIFVYNVRPQAMARLGLSYEVLAAINPRLIYVGVFGYGQDGPYAAKPAYDDLIQGASTLSSLFSRASGGAPQYVPAAIADRVTGLIATSQILAAVIERQTSGQGQRIDIPMFENMVNFVLGDHLGGLGFEPPLGEGGYARLLSKSRRPYKTKDGYVCAMVYTDKQWQTFFKLTGQDGRFESDPRFKSLATRTQHIGDIYAELEEIMQTRTTAEWLQVLGDADIPTVPMHTLDSIFQDPHLQAIGHFVDEDHPSEGRIRSLKHATNWSRTQPHTTRSAPRQGEHTQQVLGQAGYSQAEIEQLLACGAAQGPKI